MIEAFLVFVFVFIFLLSFAFSIATARLLLLILDLLCGLKSLVVNVTLLVLDFLFICGALMNDALVQPPFENLFKARLERVFNLALCAALNDDWVSEAFKQIHRIAVCLHIVSVLA